MNTPADLVRDAAATPRPLTRWGRASLAGVFVGLPVAVGALLGVGYLAMALPPVPVPPANPITENKRVLGKILFWDEQLSMTNTMSCGTCHVPARQGTDPRIAVNNGPDNVTPSPDDRRASPGVVRSNNTMNLVRDDDFGLAPQITDRAANSMINAAYAPNLFWDGRATGTFRDPLTNAVIINNGGALESQAAGPPVSSVEMGHDGVDWSSVAAKIASSRPLDLATAIPSDVAGVLASKPTYPELFQAAFGDGSVTPARIAMAIATYQRTLISDQAPFDRTLAGLPGGLSPAQQRGLGVFNAGNCNVCHAGDLTTNHSFRNIGLRPEPEDRGRQNVTNNPGDAGRFKTPGLRNASLKPTFMHNGQFNSLQQVLGFYRGARNGPLPGVTNRDPAMNTVAVPPPGSPGEADLLDFLANGLLDTRVRDGLFPFDKPTLTSEVLGRRNTIVANSGLAGTGGVIPVAIADMPALIGGPVFRVGIDRARTNAIARLGISTVAPILGRITPSRFIATVRTDGTGLATGQTSLHPLQFTDGQVVFMQWFVEDPAAPGGTALSQAVRVPPFCGSYGCIAACSVDFDADGFLTQEDLSGFLSAFLSEPPAEGPSGTWTAPCPGEPAPYDVLGYAADFNRDCAFNQEDLSNYITEYFTQAESPNGCVAG